MSVSLVNGFLCYSSCDAAKAAKGQNPHPRTDATATDALTAVGPRAQNPAIIFGGALKANAAATDSNRPDEPAPLRNQGASIDISA